MVGTASFADVLDEALSVPPPPLPSRPPHVVAVRSTGRPAATARSAFAFADAWSAPAPVRTTQAHHDGLDHPRATVPEGGILVGRPEPPRSSGQARRRTARHRTADPDLEWVQFRQVHALTAEHRAALETFRDHGVALGPDFTPADLRSAYRRLARRFHPDRHASSEAASHDVLARTFARLTEDYKVLLGAARN